MLNEFISVYVVISVIVIYHLIQSLKQKQSTLDEHFYKKYNNEFIQFAQRLLSKNGNNFFLEIYPHDDNFRLISINEIRFITTETLQLQILFSWANVENATVVLENGVFCITEEHMPIIRQLVCL